MTEPWLPRAQVYFDPVAATQALVTNLRDGARLGPISEHLAQSVATWLGAAHGVLLPHARVAFHELLGALDLEPGDEVLLTPITIPDMVNAILMRGLRPVFVDLGRGSPNVDCDALERRAGPRARVLLLTHLAGIPSDMDRIMDLATRRGLTVLEDCSQAMGATWGGRALGTFGRAAFYSLTTLKPLSTFAGGLVITDDAPLAATLRARAAALPPPAPSSLLRLLARDHVLWSGSHPAVYTALTHTVVDKLQRARPGWLTEVQRGNLAVWRPTRDAPTRRDIPPEKLFQYTDAQAAVGLAALPSVEPGNRARRELSLDLLARLKARRAPGAPRMLGDDGCTFWRFPYFSENVAKLRRHLWRRRIDAAPTNLPCLSAMADFSDLAADTPEANRYADRMVFLPMHPTMTPRDVERIAEAISHWHGGGGR